MRESSGQKRAYGANRRRVGEKECGTTTATHGEGEQDENIEASALL